MHKQILLGLLVVLLAVSAGVGASSPCLIFHLDAVSSPVFFRELEAGNLPNIERLFAGGIHIKHGLTLYPGGTEVIYPRLKMGIGNDQGRTVSWGLVDPETEEIITSP